MTEMRETWKEFSAALGHTFRFIRLQRLSLQSELSDEEMTALCPLSNTSSRNLLSEARSAFFFPTTAANI